MGEVNEFRVSRKDAQWLEDLDSDAQYPAPPDSPVDEGVLIVRPERIRMLSEEETADSRFEGVVEHQYVLGSRVQYQVRVKQRAFLVETMIGQPYQVGDSVSLGWDADQSVLMSE